MSAPIEKLLEQEVEWTDLLPADDLGPGDLYAVKTALLRIGGGSLRCYVLNDGQRVFDADSLAAFLGLSPSGDAA